MSEGVLGTSVVVDLGRHDASDLPERMSITSITLGELAVGPLIADDPSERARRLTHLRLVEEVFHDSLLPYDTAAARAFGGVMAGALARGRTARRRTSDYQIAAIAIANRLPLYTVDIGDFVGIDGLEVREVTDPSRR